MFTQKLQNLNLLLALRGDTKYNDMTVVVGMQWFKYPVKVHY